MTREKKSTKHKIKTKGATRSYQQENKVTEGFWRQLWKLIKLVVILVLCVGAFYFFYGQWQSLNNKPVSDVLVKGDFIFVSKEKASREISGAINKGFLALDLDAIQIILKSDPWVDRVVIKRHWPSTLEVRVVEHKPIALWGSWGVLNHRGEVIRLPDDFKEGELLKQLPRLNGPKGTEQELMKQYQSLMQMLASSHLVVETLTLDDGRSWRSSIDGVEVNIGRDRMTDKISDFLLVYNRHLKSKWNTLKTVDLRYKSGVAVSNKAAVSENE